MAVLVFFVLHWQLSVMLQSFFQHRYASHGQFQMSKGWERCFHLLAFLIQGSSFLPPGPYAVLHRMHHAYADTPKDPHSPRYARRVDRMMQATADRFGALVHGRERPEPRFVGGYPSWPALDRLGNGWPMRILWGALYTLFYLQFATHWWMFALLPFHYMMGPVHGAIVNWCGHRYGYRNFPTPDDSRNTLGFDVLCMGELFQNNHHALPGRANFGYRRGEIDPAYWLLIRPLAALGVIRFPAPQKPPDAAPASRQDPTPA